MINKIIMCLSIPARIESIDGEMAIVNVGGVEYNASLQMVEDVKIGDYVLLHTGFAIQKISEEEARETFELLHELEKIDRQIDQEEKK
jgi:hydrogenase expression/formation protein HypC